VAQRLTPTAYDFIGTFSQTAEESKASKNALNKESKLIPSLIFAIEQYEAVLIKLSKTTRMELMQYQKRSIVRDFKIDDSRFDESAMPAENHRKEPKAKEPKGDNRKRATKEKAEKSEKPAKKKAKENRKNSNGYDD